MTKLPHRIKSDLDGEIAGEVLATRTTRVVYSNAACIYSITPLAVVRPKNAEDIAKVMRYASGEGIPITARGAGSGVAGHSIGSGIILDLRRHMNAIVAEGDDWIEVEPGVVLDDLNRRVAKRGMRFSPDPSSGSYCTIGGMIANNSSGARGIVFGSTRDHVVSLQFCDAGGNMHDTANGDAWIETTAKGVADVIASSRNEIESRKPKVTKNSSGYNLWSVERDSRVDLSRLIVGSEGTLAIVTKARLKLSPTSAFKGAALLHFKDMRSATEAVPALRETGPAAMEIMDSAFLAIVRSARNDLRDLLGGAGETLLLLEYEANDNSELQHKLTALQKVASAHGEVGVNVSANNSGVARLWSVRKAGSPIISRIRGSRRPLRFVEDVVVPPERFAEFASAFMGVLDKHDCRAPVIGHAGDGNIHVNPIVDIKSPDALETIRRVADEIYDLVARYDGSMTGEHGDGRLRAPYLKNHFGATVYEAFKKVKSLFDPKEILNPGVKIGDAAITDNIKYMRSPARTGASLDESSARDMIAQCHGCGDCVTDCPSFKVTRSEESGPRGRINIARGIANGDLSLEEAVGDPDFLAAVSECFGCGRCEMSCSSDIDVPGLMSHMKGMIRGEGFRAMREDILKNPRRAFWLMSRIAPISAPLMKLPGAVAAASRLLGINPDARLPIIDGKGLKYNANEYARDSASADVIYFPGCYATFLNPGGVGMAVLHIIEKLGIKPGVATFGCCGLPMYSSGNREIAIVAQRTTVSELAAIPNKPIVTSCPSCKRMLTSVEFDDNPMKSSVASRMVSAEEFILERIENVAGAMKPLDMKIAAQVPCHQRGTSDVETTRKLLGAIKGIEIVDLPDECCGMGGATGMRIENREMSAAAGKRLLEALRDSGADLAVTPCGSCESSLSRVMKTIHPLLLVARALGYEK